MGKNRYSQGQDRYSQGQNRYSQGPKKDRQGQNRDSQGYNRDMGMIGQTAKIFVYSCEGYTKKSLYPEKSALPKSYSVINKQRPKYR